MDQLLQNYKGDVSSDDENESDGDGPTAILLTPASGSAKARKISTSARRSQGATARAEHAAAAAAAAPKATPAAPQADAQPAALTQGRTSQSAGVPRPGPPRAGLSRPGPARSTPSQPGVARGQPVAQPTVQQRTVAEQVEDGLSVIVRELDEEMHDMIGNFDGVVPASILRAMGRLIETLNDCFDRASQPASASFFAQRLRSYIIMFDRFFKEKNRGEYYSRLIQILRLYTDFEIASSLSGAEADEPIVQRIKRALTRYLEFPSSRMFLDVLLSCRFLRRQHRGLVIRLFELLLMVPEGQELQLPDAEVMKYVVLYRKWIQIDEVTENHSKLARQFANSIKIRDSLRSSDMFKNYLPAGANDNIHKRKEYAAGLFDKEYQKESLMRKLHVSDTSQICPGRNDEVIIIDDDDDDSNDSHGSLSASDEEGDDDDGEVEPIFWKHGLSLPIRNLKMVPRSRVRGFRISSDNSLSLLSKKEKCHHEPAAGPSSASDTDDLRSPQRGHSTMDDYRKRSAMAISDSIFRIINTGAKNPASSASAAAPRPAARRAPAPAMTTAMATSAAPTYILDSSDEEDNASSASQANGRPVHQIVNFGASTSTGLEPPQPLLPRSSQSVAHELERMQIVDAVNAASAAEEAIVQDFDMAKDAASVDEQPELNDDALDAQAIALAVSESLLGAGSEPLQISEMLAADVAAKTPLDDTDNAELSALSSDHDSNDIEMRAALDDVNDPNRYLNDVQVVHTVCPPPSAQPPAASLATANVAQAQAQVVEPLAAPASISMDSVTQESSAFDESLKQSASVFSRADTNGPLAVAGSDTQKTPQQIVDATNSRMQQSRAPSVPSVDNDSSQIEVDMDIDETCSRSNAIDSIGMAAQPAGSIIVPYSNSNGSLIEPRPGASDSANLDFPDAASNSYNRLTALERNAMTTGPMPSFISSLIDSSDFSAEPNVSIGSYTRSQAPSSPLHLTPLAPQRPAAAPAPYRPTTIDDLTRDQSTLHNIFDSPEPRPPMANAAAQQAGAPANRPYQASTPLPQQRPPPPLVVQNLHQNQTANVVQILRSGVARTALPTAVRVVTVTQGRPIGASAVVRANLVAAPVSSVARIGLSGSPTRLTTAARIILNPAAYNVGNAERVVTVPTYTVNGTLLSNVPVQIVDPTNGPFVPLARPIQAAHDLTASTTDTPEQSGKRKRGRPRKYPLQLDADGNPVTPRRTPRVKKPRSEYPPFERMVLRPRGADGRVRRKSIVVPAPKRIEYMKRRRTRLLSRRTMNIITEPAQPTILRRRDYNKPNRTNQSGLDFSGITASSIADSINRSMANDSTLNGNETTVAATGADDTQRSSILRRHTYIKEPPTQYKSVNNPQAIKTRVFMRSRSQRYSRIFHNQAVMRRKSIILQQHLQQEQDDLDEQYEEEQEKLLQQQEEERQEVERQQQHEDQKRQQLLQQPYRFVQRPQQPQQPPVARQPPLPTTSPSSGGRRGRKRGSKNQTRHSYVSKDVSATPSTSRSTAHPPNAVHQVQSGSADLRTLSQANGTSRSLALNAALEVRINLMDIQTLNQIFDDSADQMSMEPNNLSVISEDTETDLAHELTTTDHDSAVEDTDDSTRKSKRSRKRPKILDL